MRISDFPLNTKISWKLNRFHVISYVGLRVWTKTAPATQCQFSCSMLTLVSLLSFSLRSDAALVISRRLVDCFTFRRTRVSDRQITVTACRPLSSLSGPPAPYDRCLTLIVSQPVVMSRSLVSPRCLLPVVTAVLLQRAVNLTGSAHRLQVTAGFTPHHVSSMLLLLAVTLTMCLVSPQLTQTRLTVTS